MLPAGRAPPSSGTLARASAARPQPLGQAAFRWRNRTGLPKRLAGAGGPAAGPRPPTPTWMSPLLKYSLHTVAISFLYATTSSRMREERVAC
jgi:hypothetical protein